MSETHKLEGVPVFEQVVVLVKNLLSTKIGRSHDCDKLFRRFWAFRTENVIEYLRRNVSPDRRRVYRRRRKVFEKNGNGSFTNDIYGQRGQKTFRRSAVIIYFCVIYQFESKNAEKAKLTRYTSENDSFKYSSSIGEVHWTIPKCVPLKRMQM